MGGPHHHWARISSGQSCAERVYLSVTGIYEIRCTANGRRYIGSASDFRSRRATHWAQLRRSSHSNPPLQAAWNKYGESSFEWGILEHCAVDDLLSREQHYFDAAAYRGERLFNILTVAGRVTGLRHSEETRRRVSENSKEMWRRNPEGMREVIVRNAAAASATKRAKTHCRRGHEFTPENTFRQKGGGRGCRACDTANHRRRRGVKADPFGPPCHHRDQTHCKHGHEYTAENTLRTKQGHRWCRACKAAADRRDHAAHKVERNAKNNRRYHETKKLLSA